MKIYFISFIILFSFCNYGITQISDFPTNIQSPNAANLGKFGDVPVSYFTGSPDIRIPLYDINVKGIRLPISLRYDASGILIGSHASSVGQNWSLEAGGVITRTMRDQFDESEKGFITNSSCVASASTVNQLTVLAKGDVDREPDIFTFNFLGVSGKFFMGNDGKWKIESENNLMIIFDNELNYPFDNQFRPIADFGFYFKMISGFKIKDGEGNTYVFGYKKESIEYSIDFFGQVYRGANWIANSWYLTKVLDKYNTEIYDFNYVRGDHIAQFYRSTSSIAVKVQANVCNLCMPAGTSGSNSYAPNTVGVEGNLISPVYLESILSDFNNVDIHFARAETNELGYDVNDLKYQVMPLLEAYPASNNSISAFYLISKNNLGTTEELLKLLKWQKYTTISGFNKVIHLSYNDAADERLNLMKVEISPNAYTRPPEVYTLMYNNFKSLPPYLSRKVDHWGYNRGVDYSLNDITSYYSQRTPDSTYLKIGLLDRIIYPTGGYSRFEFEAHTYDKIVNPDRNGFLADLGGFAGGVRIKSIIDNDGKNETRRDFLYVIGYDVNNNAKVSSGILNAKPQYYWPDWKVVADDGSTVHVESFSVNSLIPLSNSQGSHLGYSEVVEKRSDGSYRLYKYSNYGTNSLFDINCFITLNQGSSSYDRVTDLSLIRGKNLSVSTFNNLNQLLQKRIFKYRDILGLLQDPRYYTIGANVDLISKPSSGGYYKGGAYKVYSFDYDVIEDETIDYLNGVPLSKKVTYKKDDVFLPKSAIRLTKEISEINSDNSIFRSSYTYPSDNSLSQLVNDFRVNSVITSTSSRNGVDCGAKKYIYKYFNKLYLPSLLLSSETNLSSLENDVVYDSYDSFGNLLQYTTKDQITMSIIWGYNNSLPIAQVTNACYTSEVILDSIALRIAADVGDVSAKALLFPSSIFNVTPNSTGTIKLSSLLNPTGGGMYATTLFIFEDATLGTKSQVELNFDKLSASFPMTNSHNYVLSYSNKDKNVCFNGFFNYVRRRLPSETNEVFYQGFEDNGTIVVAPQLAKSGNHVFYGAYAMSLSNLKSGSYLVSYWNSSDLLSWNYKEQIVNVTPTASNFTISSQGQYLDEIRVLPIDAQMSTYSYNLTGDLISKTDENGLTSYFEYDASRRLLRIKDSDGKILKEFEYNYSHQ